MNHVLGRSHDRHRSPPKRLGGYCIQETVNLISNASEITAPANAREQAQQTTLGRQGRERAEGPALPRSTPWGG